MCRCSEGAGGGHADSRAARVCVTRRELWLLGWLQELPVTGDGLGEELWDQPQDLVCALETQATLLAVVQPVGAQPGPPVLRGAQTARASAHGSWGCSGHTPAHSWHEFRRAGAKCPFMLPS